MGSLKPKSLVANVYAATLRNQIELLAPVGAWFTVTAPPRLTVMTVPLGWASSVALDNEMGA